MGRLTIGCKLRYLYENNGVVEVCALTLEESDDVIGVRFTYAVEGAAVEPRVIACSADAVNHGDGLIIFERSAPRAGDISLFEEGPAATTTHAPPFLVPRAWWRAANANLPVTLTVGETEAQYHAGDRAIVSFRQDGEETNIEGLKVQHEGEWVTFADDEHEPLLLEWHRPDGRNITLLEIEAAGHPPEAT